MAVFWKQFETKDKSTGEPVTLPVLRYFNVFNVEQCEGITVPNSDPSQPEQQPTPFTPIEAAESIACEYQGGPSVQHTGGRAYYMAISDAVRIPEPSRFESPELYYANRPNSRMTCRHQIRQVLSARH